MTQIVFSLAEPRVLVLAVLCAVITAYLSSLREKARDLSFLLGAFSCWTIYFLLLVRAEAFYPSSDWYRIAEMTCGLLGLTFFLGFSYRFLGNPFPRESRIVFLAAGLMVAACSLSLCWQVYFGQRILWSLGSGTSSLLFVCAEGIFVRRWLTAQEPKVAAPYREFALVFLLSVSAVSLYFFRDIGLFPSGAVPLLSSLLYLATLVGFALVYVNHSPQPTTFQVKIVGLSLVTILAVLTMMWTVLAPAPSGTVIPPQSAVRFIPSADGTYQVSSIPAQFEKDFGSHLQISGDVEKRLELDWPFRFYSRPVKDVRALRAGIVLFSSMPLHERKEWSSFGPFASPLNLDPYKTELYVKRMMSHITFTWKCPRVAVQLVLHQNGAIDFVYDRVDYARTYGQRGISAGGPFFFSPELTTSLPAQKSGRLLIEDFELRSRLQAQESIRKCVYTILGSTVFILIVFPLFFRASLVEPLNSLLKGIDQVDEGSTDIQLPVAFNDEIGRLTENFNRMTRSLRAAQDELVFYAQSLERKVDERTAELARKNEENERLLLNILPASIAERLKNGESTIADACSETTILFADIVGFTELSSHIPASELVGMLSSLVSEFDELARQFGVEKIKTIGDAYMAVAGLPDPRSDHAQAAMRLAIAMTETVSRYTTRFGHPLQLRIGMDSGPVIAGVIGTHKFAYDLWGDAVNTASRMQSHGKPGRIQVTEATYRFLRDSFKFEPCGNIEVKGKGNMPAYLLALPREQSPSPRPKFELLPAVRPAPRAYKKSSSAYLA